MRLSRRQREKLPSSLFACPNERAYPLTDRKHVASARAYYRRRNTLKCAGGKERICRRAKQLGMLDPSYRGYREWRRWCK